MKIAFLACAQTIPGAADRRADAFEHDELIAALRQGLAGSGSRVTDCDWRGPMEPMLGSALALIGTAWDYTDHLPAFFERLTALEAAGVQICNPIDMLRWNADKSYLTDLERRGAASIPTIWIENPGPVDIAAAHAAFDCDRVVVKRRVGAGAIGQFCFSRHEPPDAAWSMGQAALIQPFLPAIVTEGELSFIFVDGHFSHALVKQAADGDYRIQSLYGGREQAIVPAAGDLDAAEQIMALLPFSSPPLYARIDMVRGTDGRLMLMEAELIEPYLYPLQDKQFGTRLARAVLDRL